MERINRDHINPVLRDLVHTPFFQYFKVDLYTPCPLWPDDGMCMLRDCSVCECDPDEVPKSWRKADEPSAGEECGTLLVSGNLETAALHVKHGSRILKCGACACAVAGRVPFACSSWGCQRVRTPF